jgi:hypothetical protein
VLPRPEIDSLSPAKLDSTNDQRVYINWPSQRRRASFSLQDNALTEHEGPPAGAPSQPERCLIHYGAPTEPGNSGSVVFNEAPEWQVISLHHAGGEYVRKLNGQSGTYAANEAIWIQSISKAMGKALRRDPMRAIISFRIARPSLGRGSSPRLSGSLGIGIARMGRQVISTVSPKYVLFFGNDALDGFHERQVSLSLWQSSVGTGAVGI